MTKTIMDVMEPQWWVPQSILVLKNFCGRYPMMESLIENSIRLDKCLGSLRRKVYLSRSRGVFASNLLEIHCRLWKSLFFYLKSNLGLMVWESLFLLFLEFWFVAKPKFPILLYSVYYSCYFST